MTGARWLSKDNLYKLLFQGKVEDKQVTWVLPEREKVY
jgi:hypothetical protein